MADLVERVAQALRNSQELIIHPNENAHPYWKKRAKIVIDIALEEAAQLHQQINPASDQERLDGDPGAGAMGAVIEYRDAIRALKGNPKK